MMRVSEWAKLCALGLFCDAEEFFETEIYCEYQPVKAALLATSKTNMTNLFTFTTNQDLNWNNNWKRLPLFDHDIMRFENI